MKHCKVVGKDHPMLVTCNDAGCHLSGIIVYKDKDGNIKVKVGLEDMVV